MKCDAPGIFLYFGCLRAVKVKICWQARKSSSCSRCLPSTPTTQPPHKLYFTFLWSDLSMWGHFLTLLRNLNLRSVHMNFTRQCASRTTSTSTRLSSKSLQLPLLPTSICPWRWDRYCKWRKYRGTRPEQREPETCPSVSVSVSAPGCVASVINQLTSSNYIIN